MSQPRTGLILDFGGVLTTSISDCALAFDRRSGLADGTLLALIGRDPRGAALYADLERGAITQTEWNERTGALLGVDPAGLAARVLAGLRPQPALVGAARAARAAGVTVGVLSNSVGVEPFDPYEGYELDTGYDAVLISEDHRMRKPDPEIYRIMLDLMGLPGERCVFVDDTARNLPPAQALGVATVLATDPASTVAAMESLLGMPLAPPGRRGPSDPADLAGWRDGDYFAAESAALTRADGVTAPA
jgi:putative hydrolase of the HAD superfamily